MSPSHCLHRSQWQADCHTWGAAYRSVNFESAPQAKTVDVEEACEALSRVYVAGADAARVHGDDAAYTHFRDRYRDMAKTLGYEGHIAWAEAMP